MRLPEYNHQEQQHLLEIAFASIQHGLECGGPLLPALDAMSERLTAMRASFVSLHLHGELRGCIGSLIASKPLAEDVAHAAYQAAFKDPRFPALNHRELPELTLEVSVLSPLQKLPVGSEQELLNSIQPGVDGLVLEDPHRRATFLPKVWDSLATPETFLHHLKDKGGWPRHYWSADIQVYRYHTETFSRAA